MDGKEHWIQEDVKYGVWKDHCAQQTIHGKHTCGLILINLLS